MRLGPGWQLESPPFLLPALSLQAPKSDKTWRVPSGGGPGQGPSLVPCLPWQGHERP